MMARHFAAFGRFVRVAFGVGLMVSALGSSSAYSGYGYVVKTPEIDSSLMVAAVTLLSGAVLIVTNRRRGESA